MNRLIERAPSFVEIDGQSFAINTNYIDCLKTVLALQNSDLTTMERTEILLYNTYSETPHNGLEAARKALWFLRCGREQDDRVIAKLCDFAQDDEHIYNALLKKGIDLDKSENMHWWTFMSHFSEIPESTFTRIVYLRNQSNKGKLTKEEKEECARIGWNVIRLHNSNDE